MDYLLKTEPSTYSFADLQREKTTIWDGVSNPVALKNMRGMKPGERLVIYHTGDEKSAVGTATVVSVDESDAQSAGEDQSREGDCEAGDPGGSEGEQVVRGFSAGAAGKAERGAAERGAVQVSDWRVRTVKLKIQNPRLALHKREDKDGDVHPFRVRQSAQILRCFRVAPDQG